MGWTYDRFWIHSLAHNNKIRLAPACFIYLLWTYQLTFLPIELLSKLMMQNITTERSKINNYDTSKNINKLTTAKHFLKLARGDTHILQGMYMYIRLLLQLKKYINNTQMNDYLTAATRGSWAVPSSACRVQDFLGPTDLFFGWFELLNCWMVKLWNCWVVELLTY